MTSWWQRPAGEKDVLRLAVPLVVAIMSWAVMNVCDRALLNRQSSASMSAAFYASTIWFVWMALPLGICMYVNTFVAQYSGSGQSKRVGRTIWQGVWVALALTPAILVGIPIAPTLFHLAEHGADITSQEACYFQILCYGSFPMLAASALASFYSGRGKVGVVMLVDSSAAALNFILDYCWIAGHAGFPAMGIAGAGWATAVSLWIRFAIYLALVLRRTNRERYDTAAGMRFDRKMFASLLIYGGPIGVQTLLDVAAFTAFVTWVGQLGESEMAATGIAFSIGSLAALPVFGISQATTILVGQFQGQDRSELSVRATMSALRVSALFSLLMSVSFICTPDVFLSGFFDGTEDLTEGRALVRETTYGLLYFLAGYSFLDTIRVVLVAALKGAGDTWFVGRISVVAAIALAGLIGFGVESGRLSLIGCWIILVIWMCMVVLIVGQRCIRGEWLQMRVIGSSSASTSSEYHRGQPPSD